MITLRSDVANVSVVRYSVSGHSSELSIANHSSQSTVSQLKCVSGTISSWFENHQPQKTNISTVIYAPFIQNSNQMASWLTATTSFPTVLFSTPAIFQATSKLFGSQGCPDDKNWLDFYRIFLKIFKFHSSILLSLQVSFHERSDARVRIDSGVIFLGQSQFYAKHSNQWNCFILYTLRQMAFSRLRQSEQRRGKDCALCWSNLK